LSAAMNIDWWTLGLQTINVVVLLWVLQRFLFKPVLAIIAQRQAKVEQLTADAQTAREQAEKLRAELETQRTALSSTRAQSLAEVQAEVQKLRDTLLAQARKEAQDLAAASTQALARERTAVEKTLCTQAAMLAGDMARRLLERLPAQQLARPFMEAAVRQLKALGAAETEALRQGEENATAQVISASTLSADEQEFLRAALASTLGRSMALSFSVDPALIAGVELRFRHLIIRSHWAADLEQLQTRLQHDDQHPAHSA
jgi:F-type H+-transporting ATPase subunit b